jgi:hypothetical protein
MLKTLYAIIAAAIVAACFVLSPVLSPSVEAGAPAINGKADRADTRPLGVDCSQHAWPYYESSCLRDTANRLAQPRDVRFIPMDRKQRPAVTTAVALR